MPGNIDGCLIGTVDDYLESFDDQIERLKAQFTTTREYWQNQAAGQDEQLNDKLTVLQDCQNKIQEGYNELFCRAAKPVICKSVGRFKFSKNLMDLENFGGKLPEHPHNIRWTVEDELEKWQLTKPPRITAIRTRGCNKLLMAMQLVFEDGHESPFFDTKKEGSTEIKTVELTGKTINKIIRQGAENTVRFWFEHEGGRQIIYDEGHSYTEGE